MIRKLTIKNFRAIREAELELAPITVLTGANNAGKSTVMYALVTAKNVITNPNQPIDAFFNLGFLNLGGYKQAVFVKDESQTISLSIDAAKPDAGFAGCYGLTLGKQSGGLHLHVTEPFSIALDLEVTFPYALSTTTPGVLEHRRTSFQVTWNGLAPNVAPSEGQSELTKEVAAILSFPVEEIRKVDMVPLRRGFSKPVYAATTVTPQLLLEDEVATILASDSDLLGRVDRGLETILNRNLVVFTPPTTASSYLQSRNRETGTTSELVNEGFGTNQLVYLLAKIHRDGNELVCIEEPEIHLHPSAISKFTEHLVRTTKQSLSILRRHFIISTHSEHFVTSLLGLVAQGRLQPADVALYYASRKDYETVFEHCEISDKGQVKGGLQGFYETELEAVRSLLQVPEQQ